MRTKCEFPQQKANNCDYFQHNSRMSTVEISYWYPTNIVDGSSAATFYGEVIIFVSNILHFGLRSVFVIN